MKERARMLRNQITSAGESENGLRFRCGNVNGYCVARLPSLPSSSSFLKVNMANFEPSSYR
jgi:hypothetical protein